MLEVTQTEQVNSVLLKLKGRLDTSSSASFDQASGSAVSGSPGHVILDMTELGYLSSAGIHSLLTIVQKLQSTSRRLILAGIQPNVREILRIAGLDRYVTLEPTVEDALKSVQA